ncbi:cobalt transporter subunit CbtA [Angulomicrobium tetraedrale]|uniref:Cobalt transporter subunit CbtA n=1 Tax=Ancylobacter tetraedralis TaxID=217068 RepID=A0A839ZAL1_9HYPH|nr:CbtA family protein [Ancylobacter tetraedralis]MBB3771757.1 cobalt transporter subunit CbtA [Ancylobacter tetraedralis]
MSLFRTILFVAALAGIGTGLVGAGLHLLTTVPLILKAETFEQAEAAAPAHDHANATAQAAGAQESAAHEHDSEAWAPADGFERNGLTLLFTVLTGFGFALLLVSASEIAGGLQNWHQGVIWGLAGFAVFTLAPGLGLPPELPAMPAGDLAARQLWWVGTAAATAGGLALLAFGRSPLLAVAGVALIVAPQLIGAPQPDSYETAIPEALHHRFVVASVAVSFVFWALLGGLAGWLRPRLAAPAA